MNLHLHAEAGERRFLGGRVVARTIPDWDRASGNEAPALKRVRLPQGDLVQIIQGGPGARYLAWVELRPGQPRGNHYHLRKEEHHYQISGEVTWVVADRETGERAEFTLLPGELLTLAPGVAHAVLPITAGQAVEFSPEPLDLSDTYRHPLVQPIRIASPEGGTSPGPG